MQLDLSLFDIQNKRNVLVTVGLFSFRKLMQMFVQRIALSRFRIHGQWWDLQFCVFVTKNGREGSEQFERFLIGIICNVIKSGAASFWMNMASACKTATLPL